MANELNMHKECPPPTYLLILQGSMRLVCITQGWGQKLVLCTLCWDNKLNSHGEREKEREIEREREEKKETLENKVAKVSKCNHVYASDLTSPF